MTALQMQGLGIPSADDPMETDADRRGGQFEDIDIDLDIAGGEQQHYAEDETMTESVTAINEQVLGSTQQTGDAYNDDEMEDDDNLEEDRIDSISLQDEDLRDAEEIAIAQVDNDEDDEIIDVADDEALSAPEVVNPSYQGEEITKTTHKDPIQEHSISQTGSKQDLEFAQQQQSLDHGENYHSDLEPPEVFEEQLQEHGAVQDSIDQLQKTNEHGSVAKPNLDSRSNTQRRLESPTLVTTHEAPQTSLQNFDTASDEVRNGPDERSVEEDSGTAALTVAKAKGAISGSLNPPDSSEEHVRNQNNESTDQDQDLPKPTAYIHPIAVLYESAELSLFRPFDGDRDFLLEDENLLDERINKLLAACRPILGEVVNNLELVVAVDDLGLEICEFATDASDATISDLLDLYLQLQHHDGVESPQEFRLRLFTRPSFSYRLDCLRNAVGQGKGLSEVRHSSNSREEETYGSPKERGKLENTGESEVYLPTQYDLDEFDHDGNNGTLDQNKAAPTQDASTEKLQPALSATETRTDRETVSETVIGDLGPRQRTGNTSDSSSDNHLAGHADLVNGEVQQAQDAAQSFTQLPESEDRAVTKIEDIPINEHDEAVDSKSSSGSSTLHDGVGTTESQTLASSNQPVPMQEEILPETEASSHTLEEMASGSRSYGSHANDEEEAAYVAEDERAQNTEAYDGKSFEFVEAGVLNQERENLFTDDADYPFGVERNAASDNQERDETTSKHEDGRSFEGHEGLLYQANDHQVFEEQIDQNHWETVEARQREEFGEGSAVVALQETHGQDGTKAHQAADDILGRQEFADGEDLEDFPEDPVTAPYYEEHNDEIENTNHSESHRTNDVATPLEKEDEITYEDEDENKPSNAEQDASSSPSSLKKRPWSQNDADECTAEEFQDSKRVRST